MRRADQRLAPNIGLTEDIGKKNLNPLTDPIERKVCLPLNRPHQAVQTCCSYKKIAECADQGQRHDNGFNRHVCLHAASLYILSW